MIPAIEKGFFQREIANASYRYQKEIEEKKRTIVGVNDYIQDEPLKIELLKMDPEGEKRQLDRLKELRTNRDNRKANEFMETLGSKAEGKENLMPYIIDCVRAYCTLGEITDVLREVFGEYRESIVL